MNHDKHEEYGIKPCQDPDCYTLNLDYNVEMEKIESLITVSQQCQQEIFFSCYLSKINGHASWTGM